MISANARRSIRELTRRRARSFLTIATIAVAIAGVWLFAIPGNVESALDRRVETDAMHTARLAPAVADLSGEQIASLRAVDNVAALDLRTLARADIRFDGRTQGVILVGVDDFDDQSVNIVSLDEGEHPSVQGELVVDAENLRTGRLGARVGDTVELRSPRGNWTSFEVRGSGGTLRYSSEVFEDSPVLYLANTDVQRVMGYPAPNSIDILATDPTPTAVAAMVIDLREILSAEIPDLVYWDVLETWSPGTWPGSDDFGNFTVVFTLIAAVAMVAALILISTTMNTVVREQIREIGVMKAIGGTPNVIAGGFIRTALLLGSLGTALGVAIGIPLSERLVRFMSAEFGGTHVAWRMSALALFLSLAVGVGGTVLASLPAVYRASRTTVREAIDNHGVVATYGLSPLDRLAVSAPLGSRTTRMGLRNATRRAGRTAATAVPIGLAVGTMLGFGSVLITATEEDQRSFDLEGADIILWNRDPGLDERAGELIESVPGVEFAHQMIYSNVELGGEKYVWGLPARSTYEHDVIDGRWYSEEEAESAARVAVLGQAVATQEDIAVGDLVTVETRRGPIELEIVGIDGHLVNDGQGLFVPFRTVLDYEGWTTGNYWVRTVAPDPSTVDAAAVDIHVALAREGYRTESSLRYIDREQNLEDNRLIVRVVMALGLPIVAIGMIGLVSAMTSNVLDRTREIGILRSIGARRRDLRRMFRAEALVIALLGWSIGIPVGYGLARLVLWVLERRFDAPFTLRYPLWPLAVALAVTVVVTLLVIRLPMRRIVRMAPGTALRYE